MVMCSPEESMCDDDIADAVVECNKRNAADDHYTCFSEYKADIYKYLREKEVLV